MKLEERSQILEAIVKNEPLIIGRINKDGRVISLDSSHMEIIKPVFQDDQTMNFLKTSYAESVQTALKGEKRSFEMKIDTGNNQLLYYDAFFTFDSVQEDGALFFLRDITEKRSLEVAVMDCEDREQMRIGRELHDTVGQEAVAVKYQLESFLQKAGELNGSKEAMTECMERIDRLISVTRSSSRRLCPHVDPEGLSSSLKDLSAHFEQTYQAGVSLNIELDEPVENETVAFNLYRIAQEACLNAVRHGGADELQISLTTGKTCLLEVKDNGSGFKSMPDYHPGMGLAMMRYRAGIIGGKVKIGVSDEGGSFLEATFINKQKDPESDDCSSDSCSTCSNS